MTPKELRHRAEKAVEASWGGKCGEDWYDPDLVVKIADAIREAVAEEREACARIAEAEPRSWSVDAPDPQQRIAAAIRARDEEETS